MGGRILTDAPVARIESRGGRVELDMKGKTERFDQVIATIPSKPLAAITPGLSSDYRRKLNAVTYLGIVFVVLVLKRRLSPFYVTNLASEDFPFTGIIEMTNLISTNETAGRHLVYLPKYTSPGDPLFEASDEEIWAEFCKNVRRVIPDFDEEAVEQRFTFRERFVQPVPTLHYSTIVPEMETNVDGLIVANTTQIINSTLNNNAMVTIAQQAVQKVMRAEMGTFSQQAEVTATIA